MYHGWNDGGSGGAISPQNSVNYYSSVLARMGPQQGLAATLHGARYGALRGWAGRQSGELDGRDGALARIRNPTDRLIATRASDNRVNMTRPVCPYPQVAQYTGVGSTNDAANFVCQVR